MVGWAGCSVVLVVLWCAVLCWLLLVLVVLCCVVVLCSVVLNCAVLCCSVLCCVGCCVLCFLYFVVVLACVVLCYAVLCFTVLCWVVLVVFGCAHKLRTNFFFAPWKLVCQFFMKCICQVCHVAFIHVTSFLENDAFVALRHPGDIWICYSIIADCNFSTLAKSNAKSRQFSTATNLTMELANCLARQLFSQTDFWFIIVLQHFKTSHVSGGNLIARPAIKPWKEATLLGHFR